MNVAPQASCGDCGPWASTKCIIRVDGFDLRLLGWPPRLQMRWDTWRLMGLSTETTYKWGCIHTHDWDN